MRSLLTFCCWFVFTALSDAQNTAPSVTAISGSGVDGSGNLTMNEDGDVTVTFTVSDAQTAGASLTVTGTRTNTTLFPSIGTSSTSRLRLATVSGGNRSLRVRPAANLHGSSSVTLTVTDAGGLTASLTFSISVTSVYDTPNIRADNFFATSNRSSTLNLFQNDSPGAEPGQTFSLQSFSQLSNGQLMVTSQAGMLKFTPAVGFTGNDSFSYTVVDNTGAQVTTTSYITVGTHLPVDMVHTDLRVLYSGGQWFSEVHADLAFGSPNVGGSSNPTFLDFDEALLLANGASSFTLPAGLNAATFSFLGRAPGESLYILPQTQNNALLWPGISTESISTGTFASYTPTGDSRATVNAVWIRCELVAARTPANAVFSMYQSGTTPVVFWDNIDGINAINETNHGGNVSDTFWITSNTHAHMNWTFTHSGRYELDVRWKAFVNDGSNLVEVISPISTLHFMVFDGAVPPTTGPMTEAPPVAIGDSITLSSYDGPTAIAVLGNDNCSPDLNEALSVTAVSQGSKGIASITPNSQTVTYTPQPGSVGTDTFTYTVSDEHGGSANAVVTVHFIAVNAPPSFTKGNDKAHPPALISPLSFPGWATNITDGDPAVLQALAFDVSVLSGSGLFSSPPAMTADGTLSYTLTGAEGESEVSVTLTDDATAGSPALTSGAQTFFIRVEAIAAWRQTYFNNSDNIASGSDFADPDNDGMNNLLEYALGSSPLAAGAPLAPLLTSGHFGYVFDRPPGVSGVIYGAEWSSTLTPNSWQPVTNTGTPPQQRFLIPLTGVEPVFLRLRIERP